MTSWRSGSTSSRCRTQSPPSRDLVGASRPTHEPPERLLPYLADLMSFQWLQMRISEERDRRDREAVITERLPRAVQELYMNLRVCVESYTQAFGTQSADVMIDGTKIRVVVREEPDGRWQPRGKIEINGVPTLPGFSVEWPNKEPLMIEIGMLPGDKTFYRDTELDQYLTMEELTRRILDRVMFPKLKE